MRQNTYSITYSKSRLGNLTASITHRVQTHLLSHVDAATAQVVDVVFAFVGEATDQPEVTKDDAGHLGDVLVTLVLADVTTVIYQTGHQVAPPSFLFITLLYLRESNM